MNEATSDIGMVIQMMTVARQRPKKNEHHQDNEQHSVHNGFLQAVYRIQDVIGSIDNDPQLHIARQ